MDETLLDVHDLCVSFKQESSDFQALDHVSFDLKPKETICIVGESGCGKSVTCLALMGLLSKNASITNGKAIFDNQNLFDLSAKQLDSIRGNSMSMIFQDPLSSLDPLYTIGQQIDEVILAHQKINKKDAKAKTIDLLSSVGLANASKIYDSYPHTLSGGMRQRAMIAMALANDPKVLIADEPTTALDVTIQAQIMDLLKKMQAKYGMSIILITHDMGVVATMADRVFVMYGGQIVESAPVVELFAHPRHPYTKALLNAIPSINDDSAKVLQAIEGSVPQRYDQMKGCRFAPRCKFVRDVCYNKIDVQSVDNHSYRCVLKGE